MLHIAFRFHQPQRAGNKRENEGIRQKVFVVEPFATFLLVLVARITCFWFHQAIFEHEMSAAFVQQRIVLKVINKLLCQVQQMSLTSSHFKLLACFSYSFSLSRKTKQSSSLRNPFKHNQTA